MANIFILKWEGVINPFVLKLQLAKGPKYLLSDGTFTVRLRQKTYVQIIILLQF